MDDEIIVSVGRDIKIRGHGDGFEELKRKMKFLLTFANPEFEKKQRMGKWTGGTPRDLTLIQQMGDGFIVPFGMLSYLFQWRIGNITFLPDAHLTHLNRVLSVVSVKDMKLYGYQENAVKWALKAKNGIIVAPCGSGKTQIGLAICGVLGMRCLWLTHTHDLLKQSMDRALSILPIHQSDVGTITEGKINVGSFITFATVQTMAKIDLDDWREYWDVIVVDECHKAVGTPTRLTMFWKVISGLSARYKIGLTATPKRSDGMHETMFALLGTRTFDISRDDVRRTTCSLKVEDVQTGWEPEIEEVINPDGTLNYVKLITNCVTNDFRNALISDIIEGATGPVLVLSERVEHLERLSRLCSRPCVVLSTAKKVERENALSDMRSGKIQVLFATYQLAKEGLDIPCLMHLVMASPVKDEITVTQSVGRVMRRSEEKEFGTVWDLCDGSLLFQRWFKKRLTIYRRLNA